MTDADTSEQPHFSPSSFMRERRPYLYSDTSPDVEYALTREVLANHLDTMTARNEENIFERFARRLAEAEVCPNRMYPASSANLDGFLAAYERAGQYLVVPFHLSDIRGQPIPIPVEPIPMKLLVVRQAWEIGENDPDMIALRVDDEPFIPDGIENAPVLGALARLREIQKAD